MKMQYILLFTILFYSVSIYPQWTNQNPVPEGNHLWSVFFVDDNTGWTVGSDGFIKKTTNAGLDWIQQNSGTTLSLKSVQFIDQNTGWICGEVGLIIKTTNGGQNWFELTSGTTVELNNLQFCDTIVGYVVGYNGTIIKTTNGGLTWLAQSSGTTSNLYSVDFVNDLLGYAVGGVCKFLKTTDGGINWIVNTLPLSSSILNCIDFVDSNVGWIGSGTSHEEEGTISKTTDGGETWSNYYPKYNIIDPTKHHKQENMPLFDIRYGIQSIYFKDSNNGYAVGGSWDGWNRCIYSTSDAGATWQIKYSYAEQTGLLSVFVNSLGKGWAVGFYGVIYMTEDNSYSWSQILSGKSSDWTGDWISSVFMINESVGWAGGFRKGTYYKPIILKTTNGGKIWKTNSEFSNSSQITESKIYFLNENIGWVKFKDVNTFKTTNGGVNWVSTGAGDDMFFLNQDTGWTVFKGPGSNGVFKTTNGGGIWVQKCSVSSSSVFFSNLNSGWAVGEGGSVLKSIDTGESWVPKTSGTTSDLNLVRFYNDNIGICAGSSGVVLLSTDGGESWISKSGPSLYDCSFTSSTTIWGATAGGTVYKTTNFGDSWSPLNTGIGGTNSFFTSENMGWVASGGNNIFKYEENVTPVELISFTVIVKDKKVILSWQTATELNNYGFDIERKINDETWDILGFVEGHGNSNTPNFYSFIDNTPMGGNKYLYRLKQIDLNGKYEYSNEIEVEMTPGKYLLYQNYPNPFNPSTKIMYRIVNESKVVITVYDILGKEVETLVNEIKEPGTYELELNAHRLASGTYIYRLVAGDYVESKKMILLR